MILTDTEFLHIINLIYAKDKSAADKPNPILSMDEELDTDKLDSLGMVIFFFILTEVFEIPEDSAERFISINAYTIRAIKDFVIKESAVDMSYEAILKADILCS